MWGENVELTNSICLKHLFNEQLEVTKKTQQLFIMSHPELGPVQNFSIGPGRSVQKPFQIGKNRQRVTDMLGCYDQVK